MTNGRIKMKRFVLTVIIGMALGLCGIGCDSGGDEEQSDPICTPEKKKCDGADIVKCNASGSEWVFFKECDAECKAGKCVDTSCTPNCSGKSCGDDGCGGTCGNCNNGEKCSGGTCIDESCTPSCLTPEGGPAECGDDGCGDSCGTCPSGESCESGHCLAEQVLDCEGFFDCISECAEDQSCVDDCRDQTDSTAAAQAALVSDCTNENCSGELSPTEVVLCLEAYCWDDLKVCFGSDCTTHYDCPDDSICHEGMCSLMFGRPYFIQIYEASVSETNPQDDFSTWDALGGMPDPYLELSVDGDLACTHRPQ
jgi:hypothetical protein